MALYKSSLFNSFSISYEPPLFHQVDLSGDPWRNCTSLIKKSINILPYSHMRSTGKECGPDKLHTKPNEVIANGNITSHQPMPSQFPI